MSVCLLALFVLGATERAAAQDPSIVNPAGSHQPSSFPKTKGGIIGGPIQRPNKAQPLYLQGDELIYDTKANRIIARGNIEIYHNNYILTADEVTYDQNANTLTAVGNVTLKEPNGNIIRAERYTLTDDFRDGFVQSLSVVTRDNTRIAAERANRREGNITEFEKGKFSPCRNDAGQPPLWCISAQRIVHDQNAATITYQDAQFELFGVPILYLPYFQHADPSVKRKSGFLMPEFSTSSTLGFTAEIPYYFALAPNYDFTYHPMFTAKLGVLHQGDWRHRVSFGDITGQYSVKLAAVEDATHSTGLENDWRGSIATKGQFSLSSWWKFGWDVTLESDDTFRRTFKLDNILQSDRINSVYLVGQSERNYFSVTGYHFGGLLLDDTSTSESRVHPVVDWNYVVGQPVLGGELSWNVNALSLSRDLSFTDALLTPRTGANSVNRISADVTWRRRLIDGIGQTYTPFANLRGDAYLLKDYVDPTTKLLVEDESLTRGVAAAGVLYAYPFVANTGSASHVVEPIGQIIARTAKTTQARLPDEDARSLVFDDTNLFDFNKFSGYDRVETGTRANVGLQYTYQYNGGGFARVLAGQSFHLAGENPFAATGVDADGKPVFSPDSGLNTDRSDYVLGLYLAPSTIFRTIVQARFDEQNLDLRRTDAFAEINYGPILAQAVYAFTSAPPITGTRDEQDIFGVLGLKLTDRWSVIGAMRFDIDDGSRIQDSIAVRYADECFVLTASYTETFVTDPTRDLTPDRALMLRFELKHLGEFRYKTDVLDHAFGENQGAAPK